MLRRVVVVLAALAVLPAAGQQKEPEYDVKAAWLYNFGTFAEWPAAAFPKADSPFVVGVIGKDPFGSALDDTFRGLTVQKRATAIRRSEDVAKLKGANLLFVPAAEKARFKEILEAFRGTNTLVVGESDGFAAKGAVLNFYLEGTRLRFEANPAAARRAGIQLSSQLLRLAKIVEDEKE